MDVRDLSGNGVVDRVGGQGSIEQHPSTHAFAITPSDSAEFAQNARSLWVGGAGNINVELLSGAQVLFSGVQAGSIIPIQVRKVLATSTTATLIVGLA